MNSINYDKCGRYFGYIFWMLIPRVAATMLENVTSPGVKIAGTILRIICEIAPAYFFVAAEVRRRPFQDGLCLFSRNCCLRRGPAGTERRRVCRPVGARAVICVQSDRSSAVAPVHYISLPAALGDPCGAVSRAFQTVASH